MKLTKHVDVPGLKKELKKAGCILPKDFPVLLEQHLRVLVHRYQDRRNPWNHRTLKTVPNTQRSFFAEPRSEWGGWFISYNDAFIRGWRKELLTPRDIVPIDKKLLGLRHQLKQVEEGLHLHGIRTLTSRFISRIPRTKRLRRGAYAHVVVCMVGNTVLATDISERPVRRVDESSIPSYKGYDHLFVFGEHVEVSIIGGHLLLKDDKFFLFVR